MIGSFFKTCNAWIHSEGEFVGDRRESDRDRHQKEVSKAVLRVLMVLRKCVMVGDVVMKELTIATMDA